MSAFGQTTFSAPSLLTEKAGEESFYVRFSGVNKAKKLLGPRGGSNYCRERRERHTSTTHFSCPSTGIPGARDHPVAAAAAVAALPTTEESHEVPQTADKTSLRAAVGGLPLLLLSRMPLLPKTVSLPESLASQKNEPEMPLACP